MPSAKYSFNNIESTKKMTKTSTLSRGKQWLSGKKPDVTITQTKQDLTQHIYENLPQKNDSGYDSLDENITVVQIDPKFQTTASMNDNRLKIVIDNFDKILEEYKDKPKLERQKSCSIIESKCILKKSISDPKDSGKYCSSLPMDLRTKSMIDLNICFTTAKPANVTQRAKSTWDVSKPSKIPVKSKLNKKISPSTPIDLNKVDRIGCTSTPLSNSVSTGINENLRKINTDLTQTISSQTLDKCITTGHRILKKVEALKNGSPNSALQRRLSYTKVQKKPTGNVTSFALLKKQNTKENIKITQKKQEEKKVKNTKEIFGLKSAYMIKKLDAQKKEPSQVTATQRIQQPAVTIRKQPTKEVIRSGLIHQKLKSIKNEVTISKTIEVVEKPTPIKDIDNELDSVVKETVHEVSQPVLIPNESKSLEKFEGKKEEKELIQEDEFDDRCSEDSGNISNENELDCEDEELDIIPVEVTEKCDTIMKSDKSKVLFEIKNKNIGKNVHKIIDQFNNQCVNAVDNSHKRKPEIFFRPGTLAHLEAQRDALLTGRVIHFQAHCRGYLARKRLQQRRLQETAVRCIQRNVKAFMAVRDWPWWRLLVRVTPLLNVHRTEEELRKKTEELEILRAKVEKFELERTTLKHDNDKLEAKLSEMTADLAEEHSTATLAAERLDAETSERIRLERELSEVQNKNKSLQQSSERLEMELLYARSDINGVISEEDEDGEGNGDNSVYKSKYERVTRELEFTRRRLQQQHEDDLEQLVGLKKQLEKKLSDAYEEVEEQRQVVGQWKRKVQKLTSEMNDLRLLMEEHNARNNLLEKKQRKFDSETQLLQDELRGEKQQKERISREKDLLLAEKFTLESTIADVRLELELKEERLNSLQQEYNDLTFGGKTEDEVATLKKQKQDAERRLHEQEEELDDLAGQVQMLEQAKVRLEMSLEQHRKESRREAQQRDDELEEVRCNAQKKVKALESQLENEHEERTLLLREKHSLERRLAAIAEAGRTEKEGDEALLQRLKRDLRRTKALLRDAQTMLERNKADSPGKAAIRQLRNQLDDMECARAAAVKAKQSIESELSDVQSQLDEACRQKSEAEDRANSANRERGDLRTQLEENEEELAEVLKKYRTSIHQLSTEQLALQEQVSLVAELEAERNSLKEQLAELTTKLESMETLGDPSSSAIAKRMELRAKELESKLEFEQTQRGRMEVQIARLKEATDKLQTELANARAKEQQTQDNLRKAQRSLRELRDEHSTLNTRETESLQKRKELEKKLEAAEAETAAARADLRLALQRIDDLQAAIQGELEDTHSDHSDSDNDSYSSDESIDTFLANHKIGTQNVNNGKSERSSLHLDTSPRLSHDVKISSPSESSFA